MVPEAPPFPQRKFIAEFVGERENWFPNRNFSLDKCASKPPGAMHSRGSRHCCVVLLRAGTAGFVAVGTPAGNQEVQPYSPRKSEVKPRPHAGHWVLWQLGDSPCSLHSLLRAQLAAVSPSSVLSILSPCPHPLPPQHNPSQGNYSHSFPQTFS